MTGRRMVVSERHARRPLSASAALSLFLAVSIGGWFVIDHVAALVAGWLA